MPYLLFPPTGPLPISQQIPSNRYNRHPQGSSSQGVTVGNVMPLGASNASSVSSASVAEKIPSVMHIAGVAGNPSLTDFTILLTQMIQAFLPPPYPSQIEPFFSPSELFHHTNHSSCSTSSTLSSYSSTPSSSSGSSSSWVSASLVFTLSALPASSLELLSSFLNSVSWLVMMMDALTSDA
ncbi:uncharacterized protein MONOS_4936 [Monocercomonoides exilis]|uniref:uncharacterized protein n=1 Tax=Monocercomonoides exilis TaxID=2049356 RepID=UPI003559D74B|nr:hypothetical protein MONOS_4936 [Monocercomonoides exilis]|eukprot:MONOS_4936.1-p1 / transcript=MONOS_4936.1 / gene=MONOS_4936 / organism=Monocercomonoides_exilis_PA203 / gene_product=unspecified product / transcript_product=unspecified product / location=Mono_scaffold00138:64598-65140(+) / protein_length=181 / sequence_SO=supercontig / SO=protein_coding / is_pseudo=false